MDKIDLREKFPLSKRKYWKKIISILISKIIFVGMFLLWIMVFNWIQKDAPSDSVRFFAITRLVLEISIGLIILHFFYRMRYVSAYIKRYFYHSDDNFLTIKKGVFTPTEIHIQYQKIQDVYVDQSLLDKVFGLYDVHISSATVTSGIEAHIDGVEKENAEQLKEFLLNKIKIREVENTIPIVEENKKNNLLKNLKEVKFSFEISNKSFPLPNKWFTKKIISIFSNSLVISICFGFFLSISDDKSGSIKSIIGLTNGLLVMILFVLFIVIFVFSLIKLYVWSKNYSFSFLSEFIEYKDGFISKNERNMPYKNIQDIQVTQGFWDRLLGLYVVSIQNASSAQDTRSGQNLDEIKIQGLSKEDSEKISEELKRVIFGKINPNSSGL